MRETPMTTNETRLWFALRSLYKECSGIIGAFDQELRDAIGNTNFKVLDLRTAEAFQALDATKHDRMTI